MSKKRIDPNRTIVKIQLFQIYGCRCMVCGKYFERAELQLHHISKWEYTHRTTLEDSSLVCDNCHKEINWNERNNITVYNRLNDKIRRYKATH